MSRSKHAIGRNRAALDLPALTSNVLSVWDAATPDEQFDGLTWYTNAAAEAYRLSGYHPQAPALMAALSPHTSLALNLESLTNLVDGGPMTTLGDPWRKATAILNGADPGTVLRGRKVRAFWHNLRDPQRAGSVTIDRHAYTLAMLGSGPVSPRLRERLSTGGQKDLDHVGVYQLFASVYRSAARVRNVLPQAMQAGTWIAWRNAHVTGWADNDPDF